MSHRLARLIGVALFVVSFWWAYLRAADLAVVSPVHWPLLLPRLVLEGVPMVIAVLTATTLILAPHRSRTLACLLGLSVVQSAAITIAVPRLEQEYKRTVHESLTTWQAAETPAPVPPNR